MRVVIMRLAMEPLRVLLKDKLTLASNDAHYKLLANIVGKQMAGDWDHRPRWRVVVAAEHTLELQCLRKAQMLMEDAQMWNMVPPKELTRRTQCL